MKALKPLVMSAKEARTYHQECMNGAIWLYLALLAVSVRLTTLLKKKNI